MNVYYTEFKKKSGELRQMKFVRPFVDECTTQFFDKNIKGERKAVLQPGFERVWDIEAQGFRVLNNNELVQGIECIGEAAYDAETNTFICNE